MDKTDSDSMAHKQEAIAKAERAFKLFDKDNDGYLNCFQNKFHKERNIPLIISKSAFEVFMWTNSNFFHIIILQIQVKSQSTSLRKKNLVHKET